MALTEEDKAWLTGALRSEMTERLDVQSKALRSEMTERFDATCSEMTKRIDALRSDFIERLEKTETTLLTEFHKWASPAELRQRSHAAAMRAFDAELEAVSDRVKKLEGPQPPAA